jgi:hypothetical protein
VREGIAVRITTEARPLPAALLREELAEALELIVPRYLTFGDGDGDGNAEPDLHPADAREAAADLLEHLQSRGLALVRSATA